MKRHKFITILLAAFLLIAALTVTTVAANPHITRGEFFTSLGKTLGLTEQETADLSFPDYNNENKIVNALVNIKYLFGRNNGTLALGEELTIKDVDYIFSRIKWPEKIVTETKYVGGGTRYITEEKLIDYSATTHAEAEIKDHLFQLAADGTYKCVFKDCDVVAPAGTIDIPTLPPGVNKTELTEDYALGYLSDQTNDEYFSMTLDKTSAILGDYFIAVDAALFEYDESKVTRIGFIDFFEKYSINSNLNPDDDAPTFDGWYEVTDDEYSLVKMLIVDTRTEEE